MINTITFAADKFAAKLILWLLANGMIIQLWFCLCGHPARVAEQAKLMNLWGFNTVNTECSKLLWNINFTFVHIQNLYLHEERTF